MKEITHHPSSSVEAQSVEPQATHKAAALTEIKALHASGRLAMHIWEQTGVQDFPRMTIGMFAGEAKNLRQQTDEKMQIQSVTILPNPDLNKSVMPYGFDEFENPDDDCYQNPDDDYFFGYLLSLDQAKEHAPLIVRVANAVLCSDLDVMNKDVGANLCNENPSGITALKLHSFYRGLLKAYIEREFPAEAHRINYAILSERESILRKIALSDDGTIANEAMDLLQTEMTEDNDKELPTNEACISATLEHVKAIIAPLYMHEGGGKETEAYVAQIKLRTALRGLEHLNEGFDLPVMLYHVAGNGAQNGTLEYLAQGKDELVKLGLTALKDIIGFEKQGIDAHGLKKGITQRHVRRLLGIDSFDRDIIGKIDAKLATLSAQTASPSLENQR